MHNIFFYVILLNECLIHFIPKELLLFYVLEVGSR